MVDMRRGRCRCEPHTEELGRRPESLRSSSELQIGPISTTNGLALAWPPLRQNGQVIGAVGVSSGNRTRTSPKPPRRGFKPPRLSVRYGWSALKNISN
jgi:hypothetical protein